MPQTDLQPFVEAVFVDGKSVNSQAKEAKVNVSVLRRLILKDPRYSVARAAGKIETKDFSPPEQLQNSPLVKDVVVGGLSYAQAAAKYGLAEQTVRLRVKKAWPDFSKKRGLIQQTSNSGQTNEFDPAAMRSTTLTTAPLAAGLLPLISWATARDWNPAAGPIPVDQVETWMAAARPHTPHSYILRVEDTGMTALPGAPRSFPMGCLIFVDTGRTEAQNGDRVIARIESTGELVFRIYLNVQGAEWLEPLNPSYPTTREPFKVVGAVFGKWEDA